ALPDLMLVGGVLPTVATEFDFGDGVPLLFDVRNVGAATAGGESWTDRIYLSTDNVFDLGDLSLDELIHDTTLTAGGTYANQFNVSLPLTQSLPTGTYYLIASIDDGNQIHETDEANTFVSAPLHLTVPPLVDLLPTSVSGPATGQPRTPSVFTWTAINQGDAATPDRWFDRIYLQSTSASGFRHLVGGVFQAEPVAPGESYLSMMTVDLPDLPDGEYRIILATDDTDRLSEGPYESNNTLVGGTVRIDHPDIVVQDLTVPATANSGQTLPVNFEFVNQGTGVASAWQQRIYLSDDLTVSADDRLLDEFAINQPLDPQQTRGVTRELLMPIDVQGAKYVLVVTDALEELGERSAGESNNVQTASIELTLSPYADLTVTHVSAPTQVIGDPTQLTVDWTVANVGTGRGLTDRWTDAIVLSRNATVGDDDDLVIATFEHSRGLEAGGDYSRSETIPLPPGTSGRFTLWVRSDFLDGDSGGNVFENGNESNNDVAHADSIDIMPAAFADLVVSNIDVPQPVNAGSVASVMWTVDNTGIGITNRGDWYDVVYLAEDPAGTQPIEGSEVRFQHFGQIAPGDSYTRTGHFIVPDGLSGDHYVIVHTAKENAPFEFIFDDNNRAASGAFPITLLPSPDLIVNEVVAPDVAEEGTLLDVSWTVTNSGLGSASGGWIDRVYLQPAGDPDGQIIQLGTFPFVDPLTPGKSYTRNEAIRIPIQSAGVFNLFVRTNFQELLYEGSGVVNNTKPEPIIINVRPRPDLQVDSITIPERLTAGTTLSPQFTVVNQGGAGTAGTKWIDRVYLSLDTVVDQADILIGELDNGSALAAGERYSSDAGSVVIPIRYRGDVYVIVQTDATDNIAEWPNNQNNISYQSIFIEPEPLADLVVSDVIAPNQVVAGAEIPVRYTVTNRGSGATHGDTWTENVWLTRDKNRPHPGQGDLLLQTTTHTGSLDRLAGYETSITIRIPRQLESGTWYVTPWVDPLDVVPEDTLASNHNPDDPDNIDNNNYKARAIQVLGAQPDLVVSEINAPAVATGGDSVTISWTVDNRGLA
ncbi:CARDB domain-containing protein, partial [Stieleria sp.]|uniref:CARDB domain-containing protein n=1 Tax=Stieleria sp. TaxID=2795976 RepID=UPI00356700F3